LPRTPPSRLRHSCIPPLWSVISISHFHQRPIISSWT
jgi:hypothetical protein